MSTKAVNHIVDYLLQMTFIANIFNQNVLHFT